jgi:hypothetical protein
MMYSYQALKYCAQWLDLLIMVGSLGRTIVMYSIWVQIYLVSTSPAGAEIFIALQSPLGRHSRRHMAAAMCNLEYVELISSMENRTQHHYCRCLNHKTWKFLSIFCLVAQCHVNCSTAALRNLNFQPTFTAQPTASRAIAFDHV